MKLDEIKRLLEKVNEVIESEEHKRREKLWQEEQTWSRDKFRRISKPQVEIEGKVPIVADPGPTMFAKIYNFSVKDYYTKPEVYLENYLKSMLYLFEMKEDTTLSRTIPFWLGTGFDVSLFGSEVIYSEDEEPWPGRKLSLENKEDLDRLSLPDFEKTGLSPLAIKFYEELTKIVEDSGFMVAPPEIIRSPYGIAFIIRGFENLAIDCITDPEFVHRMMTFITEARKHWYKERKRVLGVPIGKCLLYNDEVDNNVIGPNIYRDFVLPYEIELCEFHGGVAYWHSCGNINGMLEHIRKIPSIDMINISSWTDYEIAAKTCPDIPLEICLRPTNDVYAASSEHIVEKVQQIKNICEKYNVKSYHIRAGSLQQYSKTVQEDFRKIKEWIKIARKALA